MKQGSGEDPFADHDDDGPESTDSPVDGDEAVAESADSPADGAEASSAGEPPESDGETGAGADSSEAIRSSTSERYTDSDGSASDDRTVDDDGSGAETSDDGVPAGQTKAEADGIPWVLRRSRVKEDRGNVHQFFLREEYSAREDEIIDAVAAELDMRQKDLQKLDVREAMVAAADPEDVAAVLREWGYEYLK